MPKTWIQVLEAYSYPVRLITYQRRKDFPGFFQITTNGGRNSTVKFEKYFQENAPTKIEVWFEVVYWKLYSQSSRRQIATNRIVNAVQRNGATAPKLYAAVQDFINKPSLTNLTTIRNLLGIRSNVLAVALTLPALMSPESLL